MRCFAEETVQGQDCAHALRKFTENVWGKRTLGGGERGTESHPLLPLRISAGLEPRRCSPTVLPAVLLLPSEDGDSGCRRCCCRWRWGVGVAGRPLCGRCWARTLASAVVGTSLEDWCRCCVVAPLSSAVEDDAVETSLVVERGERGREG